MTLVQLAEFLIENKKTVYDKNGNSLFDNGIPFIRELNASINKLHQYYRVGENGRLYNLGVEGNATFCLLVNEAMK